MIIVIVGACLFFLGVSLVLVSGQKSHTGRPLRKAAPARPVSSIKTASRVQSVAGIGMAEMMRAEQVSLKKELGEFKTVFDQRKKSSLDTEEMIRRELDKVMKDNRALDEKYGALESLKSDVDRIRSQFGSDEAVDEDIRAVKEDMGQMKEALIGRIRSAEEKWDAVSKELAAILEESRALKERLSDHEGPKEDVIDLKAEMARLIEAEKNNKKALEEGLSRVSDETRGASNRYEALARPLRDEIVALKARLEAESSTDKISLVKSELSRVMEENKEARNSLAKMELLKEEVIDIKAALAHISKEFEVFREKFKGGPPPSPQLGPTAQDHNKSEERLAAMMRDLDRLSKENEAIKKTLSDGLLRISGEARDIRGEFKEETVDIKANLAHLSKEYEDFRESLKNETASGPQPRPAAEDSSNSGERWAGMMHEVDKLSKENQAIKANLYRIDAIKKGLDEMRSEQKAGGKDAPQADEGVKKDILRISQEAEALRKDFAQMESVRKDISDIRADVSRISQLNVPGSWKDDLIEEIARELAEMREGLIENDKLADVIKKEISEFYRKPA